MCVKSASNKKHKLQQRLMHPLRAKVKKKRNTPKHTPLPKHKSSTCTLNHTYQPLFIYILNHAHKTLLMWRCSWGQICVIMAKGKSLRFSVAGSAGHSSSLYVFFIMKTNKNKCFLFWKWRNRNQLKLSWMDLKTNQQGAPRHCSNALLWTNFTTFVHGLFIKISHRCVKWQAAVF